MAIFGVVREAAKWTIGVGAVYFTLNQGVWSSTQQGSRALQDVRTSVLPATDKYFQQVPSVDETGQRAIDFWNQGVQKACNGLVNSPELLKEYSGKAYEKVKETMK